MGRPGLRDYAELDYGFPQILYNPKSPLDLRLATREEELFKLFRNGFRRINPKRVGVLVKRARKSIGASIEEFQAYLQKYTLYFSVETLYKIENGTAGFTTLTIKALAEAIHMSLEDLIRPMVRAKAATAIPAIKINTAAGSRLKVFEILLRESEQFYTTLWLARNPPEVRAMVQKTYPNSEICEFHEHQAAGLLARFQES